MSAGDLALAIAATVGDVLALTIELRNPTRDDAFALVLDPSGQQPWALAPAVDDDAVAIVLGRFAAPRWAAPTARPIWPTAVRVPARGATTIAIVRALPLVEDGIACWGSPPPASQHAVTRVVIAIECVRKISRRMPAPLPSGALDIAGQASRIELAIGETTLPRSVLLARAPLVYDPTGEPPQSLLDRLLPERLRRRFS